MGIYQGEIIKMRGYYDLIKAGHKSPSHLQGRIWSEANKLKATGTKVIHYGQLYFNVYQIENRWPSRQSFSRSLRTLEKRGLLKLHRRKQKVIYVTIIEQPTKKP